MIMMMIVLTIGEVKIPAVMGIIVEDQIVDGLVTVKGIQRRPNVDGKTGKAGETVHPAMMKKMTEVAMDLTVQDHREMAADGPVTVKDIQKQQNVVGKTVEMVEEEAVFQGMTTEAAMDHHGQDRKAMVVGGSATLRDIQKPVKEDGKNVPADEVVLHEMKTEEAVAVQDLQGMMRTEGEIIPRGQDQLRVMVADGMATVKDIRMLLNVDGKIVAAEEMVLQEMKTEEAAAVVDLQDPGHLRAMVAVGMATATAMQKQQNVAGVTDKRTQ
jgi:hypothetical protein